VKGPKGTLRTPIPEGVTFKLEDGQLQAERASDDFRANHGLARALANNAVVGVTEGFTKQMDVVGVGYKADVQGARLSSRSATRTPSSFRCPRA
jgi:large subunit ribosomal protein L6